MTKLEMEKRIKDNMSNNNRVKFEKVIRHISKLSKHDNDNEFVQWRDMVVIAMAMLTTAVEMIDHVKTTKSGRETLYDLAEGLFEPRAFEPKVDLEEPTE